MSKLVHQLVDAGVYLSCTDQVRPEDSNIANAQRVLFASPDSDVSSVLAWHDSRHRTESAPIRM